MLGPTHSPQLGSHNVKPTIKNKPVWGLPSYLHRPGSNWSNSAAGSELRCRLCIWCTSRSLVTGCCTLASALNCTAGSDTTNCPGPGPCIHQICSHSFRSLLPAFPCSALQAYPPPNSPIFKCFLPIPTLLLPFIPYTQILLSPRIKILSLPIPCPSIPPSPITRIPVLQWTLARSTFAPSIHIPPMKSSIGKGPPPPNLRR